MSKYFEYGKIKVPVRDLDPRTQHLVPKKRFYISDGVDIEMILWAILEQEEKKEPWNILIVGEPGCGKSMLVNHLCSELNIPLVTIQGDGEQAVVDLIGHLMHRQDEGGTIWTDGDIPYAVRNKTSILYDEINHTLPEVLSRTHSMLDDRRVLDLKEHKVEVEIDGKTEKLPEKLPVPIETHFFATMNPFDTGRHVGTKPLSPALESRFALTIQLDYLPAAREIELLKEKTGIDDKSAKIITEVAGESRDAFRNQEVNTPIDHRMTLAWARLSILFGLKAAAYPTIINKLSESDRDAFRALLITHGIEKATGRKQ